MKWVGNRRNFIAAATATVAAVAVVGAGAIAGTSMAAEQHLAASAAPSNVVKVSDMLTERSALTSEQAFYQSGHVGPLFERSSRLTNAPQGSVFSYDTLRAGATSSAVRLWVDDENSSGTDPNAAYIAEQRTWSYASGIAASKALTAQIGYLRSVKLSAGPGYQKLHVRRASVNADGITVTAWRAGSAERAVIFRQGNVVTVLLIHEWSGGKATMNAPGLHAGGSELARQQYKSHGSSSTSAAVSALGLTGFTRTR